jgi:polyhydroxyalkanoate synthesis regulator phasin
MLVAAALAALTLTACGASAPPAEELAGEVIDSLVLRGQITAEQGDCMHEHVATFEGELLDDLGERAASENAEALAELEEFQAALARCTQG